MILPRRPAKAGFGSGRVRPARFRALRLCVTQTTSLAAGAGLRAVLSPHALRFTTPNSGCESESAVWGRLLLCGDSLNARRERNASERRQAGTVNCKEPNSSLRRVQNIQETAVAG